MPGDDYFGEPKLALLADFRSQKASQGGVFAGATPARVVTVAAAGVDD